MVNENENNGEEVGSDTPEFGRDRARAGIVRGGNGGRGWKQVKAMPKDGLAEKVDPNAETQVLPAQNGGKVSWVPAKDRGSEKVISDKSRSEFMRSIIDMGATIKNMGWIKQAGYSLVTLGALALSYLAVTHGDKVEEYGSKTRNYIQARLGVEKKIEESDRDKKIGLNEREKAEYLANKEMIDEYGLIGRAVFLNSPPTQQSLYETLIENVKTRQKGEPVDRMDSFIRERATPHVSAKEDLVQRVMTDLGTSGNPIDFVRENADLLLSYSTSSDLISQRKLTEEEAFKLGKILLQFGDLNCFKANPEDIRNFSIKFPEKVYDFLREDVEAQSVFESTKKNFAMSLAKKGYSEESGPLPFLIRRSCFFEWLRAEECLTEFYPYSPKSKQEPLVDAPKLMRLINGKYFNRFNPAENSEIIEPFNLFKRQYEIATYLEDKGFVDDVSALKLRDWVNTWRICGVVYGSTTTQPTSQPTYAGKSVEAANQAGDYNPYDAVRESFLETVNGN